MKTLSLVVMVALMASLSTVAIAGEGERVARVVDIEGVVMARVAGGDGWTPVKVGDEYREGDIIKTKGDSWALLNLNGGGETAAVEMERDSELLLSELKMDAEKGAEQTLLDLAIGKVLIRAQKLHSDKSRFEVKTPTSIVGVRGTTFAVEVEALMD